MRIPSRSLLAFSASLCLGALMTPRPASAVLPLPLYPQCGAVPDEDDATCPSDFNEDWRYLSYIKAEYKANIRPQEWAMGSGVWLDKTLAVETGDTRVAIAILDSGIQWDEKDTLNKYRLNTAELPLPQDAAGQSRGTYDFNGDGIVTLQDYAQDARVKIASGVDAADGFLDPSDLIATFSDGIDQDANGYTDDISGWDFFWNDNDPYDTPRYGHGTGEAKDSGSEGGDGGSFGTCPNCMIVMLRVGDSFITDISPFAEAVVYAADNRINVIQEALGTVNNSTFAQDALNYAYANGVTVVASAADETSIHQNAPANNEGTLVVHSMRYDSDEESTANTFLAYSNCTNFGGHLDLDIAATACSSEATGRGAGLVGMLYSSALHNGLTLTPREVRQLLIQTVDDVDVAGSDQVKKWYPSKPGWDRYFGYGRANIFHAIERVIAKQIPPEADLETPEWFQVLDPARTPVVNVGGYLAAKRSSSYTWTLEYAVGLDPADADFVALKTGSGTQPFSGTLASFDLTKIPHDKLDPTAEILPLTVGDDNVSRIEKVNRYTITVRVRIVDAAGLKGESRRTLYVREDPDMLPGWPIYVGGSMESSPRLIDLDGDGKDDLVQATADGRIYALRANGTNLPGWPVSTHRLATLDPSKAGNHLAARAYKSGAVSAERGQSTVATPAVADLDRDGKLEIIQATYDGELYAWHANGTPVSGFPVTLDYSKGTDKNTSTDNYLEAGFFGSPALGDLDGDGYLDIVIGAMDQWVYAWDHNGRPLPGWPVYARYTGAATSVVHQDRITVSPALGDIDRDGFLDVVIGTNEIVDGKQSPTYAIHSDGNLHAGGAFLKGWPVLTQGIFADVLPVVGKGTTVSPVLADIDGDGTLEVATATVTGYPSPKYPSIFRWNGKPFSSMGSARRDWGKLTNTDEAAGFVTISTGTFGDINRDGKVDYAMPLGGLKALVDLEVGGKRVDFNYLIGAWDAKSGRSLDGFPQQVADMQFFMNPIIADLDGDGLPELTSGNGAFTVDAFNKDGSQPAGYPKFTGQWNIASPTVGDLDGDGMLELVQSTRNGWIFAWHTTGATVERGGVVEWGTYRHDTLGTGNYQTPVQGLAGEPARRTALATADEAAGCSSLPGSRRTGLGLWGLALVGVGLLRRRRG